MDINNMELLNDSGLSSLSGFSYQIKVFILRLTQLQQGQRVEFETLDDVAVRSLSSKDSISDSCFKWKVDETSSIEVFQVKQTNLQKSEMQIILFDDEDASSLGLTPDHSINLLGEDKSGFNPFYMPSKEDSPNAPEEVE